MTSANKDNVVRMKGAAQQACPICESQAEPEYAPFCSKRCADVDLHRWLSGQYAIPGEDDDSDGAPADNGEVN